MTGGDTHHYTTEEPFFPLNFTFFGFNYRYPKNLLFLIINPPFLLFQIIHPFIPHILVPKVSPIDNSSTTNTDIPSISTSQTKDLDIEPSSTANLSSDPAQTLPERSSVVSKSTVKVSFLSGKRLHSSLSPPLIPADILRTMPRSRVDDVSKSSTSTHLELDKNVVLDFGVSVAPSFSGVDSLPEVSSAPLLSSVSSPSSLSSAPPAWFTAFQAKFEKYEERLSQLESLVAENAALKKELEAARAKISQLESMSGPSSASLVVSSVSSGSSAPVASPSGPVSKWATVAAAAPAPAPTPGEAYGKSKKSVSSSPSGAAVQAKPKVKITSRHRKAAARIFVVSSPPAGSPVDGPLFEYVYLPNKYRARLSVFRQKLRLIGLDNSRVLDVHYPARHVVALLIHTAYKEDLLKVLNKYSLPILTDFDPVSAANVRDPSFASLDSDALTAKARELQQARLVRALGYIREQTRRLVAYDFVRQGWLSKEQASSAIGSPSFVAGVDSASSADMDITLTGAGELASLS